MDTSRKYRRKLQEKKVVIKKVLSLALGVTVIFSLLFSIFFPSFNILAFAFSSDDDNVQVEVLYEEDELLEEDEYDVKEIADEVDSEEVEDYPEEDDVFDEEEVDYEKDHQEPEVEETVVEDVADVNNQEDTQDVQAEVEDVVDEDADEEKEYQEINTFARNRSLQGGNWWSTPDNEITLTETETGAGGDVYVRLRAAVHNAPQNQVTHIYIPFHMNVSVTGLDMSVFGIPDGATVVLIGAHPGTEDGRITISDTTGPMSRTFRVRGNGQERTALVFENIILQNSGTAATGVPATPPPPLAQPQTAGARGGGVTVESGDAAGGSGPSGSASGGGGHFILGRNSVIRNVSTDNRGAVDVQVSSRFTMLPSAEMYNNLAENAGGAVHVAPNATFTMYGGTIRDNQTNGVNTSTPNERAVGGGVVIRSNAAGTFGGTFNMHGGVIRNNTARNTTAFPTATNAIVTSSGGGVFVIGAASSFNMFGGIIQDNVAMRDNVSNIAIGAGAADTTNRANFRAGNGGGVFITDGATFTMNGGEIANNRATSFGTGHVTNQTALNVGNGGGVFVNGANSAFIQNGGTISNNIAERNITSAPTMAVANAMPTHVGNGGGISVFAGGNALLNGGHIQNNQTLNTGTPGAITAVNPLVAGNGGGIFASGANSRVTLNGTNISANTANQTTGANITSGYGGGIAAMAGASIHSTTTGESTQPFRIEGNTAQLDGGGIFHSGTGVQLNNGVISGNISNDGGAILSTNTALVDLSYVTINRNDALQNSGVLLPNGANLRTHNVAFTTDDPDNPTNLSVGNNATVTMTGDGTRGFTNITNSSHGGALRTGIEANINIDGVRFANNSGDVNGAAITLGNNSILNVRNSEFVGNQVNNSGGAIFIPSGSANFDNVTFEGNTAGSNDGNNGGALLFGMSGNNTDTLTISNTEFIGNQAFVGGALHIASGIAHFDNVSFVGNIALQAAGALRIDDAQTTITASSFTGNQADIGGAIVLSTGSINMTGSEITDNQAQSAGGLFLENWGTTSFENVMLARNTATQYDGGAIAMHNHQLTINNSRMNENSAYHGGAISVWAGNGPTITGNSELRGNQAQGNGGAIAINVFESTLRIDENVVFADNSAYQAHFLEEEHQDLHDSMVFTESFTVPFTWGFNNYDIEYTAGDIWSALTTFVVPELFDFGLVHLSPFSQVITPHNTLGELSVTTFSTENWRVNAQITSQLFNETANRHISSVLHFRTSKGTLLPLSDNPIVHRNYGTVDITQEWEETEENIVINHNLGSAFAGQYTGVITWTLTFDDEVME